MSRIGIRPITIPAGVEIAVEENNVIKVKGPKGELCHKIGETLTVEIEENVLTVKRLSDFKFDKAQHGLGRTLINNMIEGVSKSFKVKMTVNGVGYTVAKQGDTLVMKLGFSHPVEMKDPAGITTETPDATTIIVKGCDKAEVGNYAANIRAWRKPEPYKSKGIMC